MLQLVDPHADDCIVEIGPGTGCLTDHLIRMVQQLIAIEVDHDCVEHLRAAICRYESCSIIDSDF